MKNLLATTAVFAALTVGGTASAQGLGGGAYVTIFGGYDITRTDNEISSGTDTLELEWQGAGGAIFGAAVGTQFGPGLRAEAELSYSTQDLDELSLSGTLTGSAPGDGVILSNTYLLANAWYDVPAAGGFTPYVGGGLGFGIVNIDEDGVDSDADGVDPATGVAFQIGAGVQVPAGAGTFDISYRFRGVAGLEFENELFTEKLEGASYSNSLQAGYVLKF